MADTSEPGNGAGTEGTRVVDVAGLIDLSSTERGRSGGSNTDVHGGLASPDPRRRAAAVARAAANPSGERWVVGALDDPDPSVRLEAVRTLARLARPRGIRALSRVAAGDVSRVVRREAVAGIGRILTARWTGRERAEEGPPHGGP